jgi:hypothetical protein
VNQSFILSRRSFAALLLGSLPTAAVMAQAATDPLPSWRDGATKRAILEFLRTTTTPESPGYVPPSERTAVFDNDGTLWVEQPVYPQIAFAVWRLKALAPQHPEWADHEPFRSALAGDMTALAKGGLRAMLPIALSAQANTTPEAFHQIVTTWLSTARNTRFRSLYTECIYQPMAELMVLFRAKGFRTWIISGNTAEFLRPWTQRIYGVPSDQVVGSTLRLSYQVQNGRAEVVQLDELEDLNEGPSKVANISRVLGRRPLAAFGNSDGDYEMLQFTTTGPGARLGVLIHHDDADREYAYDRNTNIGKLDRGLTDAAARGWLVASMKNDWSRVFAAR